MIIVLELIIFISMVIIIIYNPTLLLQILDKKIENIKKENRGNVYFIDVQISVPFRDTQYGDLYGAWSLITTLTTLTHQKQKEKKNNIN